MFCVECGKEPEKLYDGMCRECFIDKKLNPSIDDKVFIDICSVCGSVRKEGKWLENPDMNSIMLEKIEDALKIPYDVDRYSFQAEFDEEDPKNVKAKVTVNMMAEDVKVEKDLEAKIIFKKTQCKICSRIHGNYYEAILQVRPSSDKMTDEQKKIVADRVKKVVEVEMGEVRRVFLAFFEERHGGVDYYLSDKNVTKKLAADLARDFGGEITTSGELAGMEDGQKVYKMTYSVRLPPYEKGDFVRYEGKLYRVSRTKNRNGQVFLQDVKSGQEISRTSRSLEDIEVLGGEEMIQSAVVVFESEKEIKILDPDTYKTKTLLKKDLSDEIGDEVDIVKAMNKTYLLPGSD
ncbi:MAG: 60S ribosomal export protein NMD3 [Thermoplasmatota archaeon]